MKIQTVYRKMLFLREPTFDQERQHNQAEELLLFGLRALARTDEEKQIVERIAQIFSGIPSI